MSPIFPVNYLIRPNKNVERKLVFDLVAHNIGIESLRNYKYIGFGSIWFADYILAHKYLGIAEMVSIEKHPMKYNRAVFNRPFSCVKVEEGDSTRILPSIFKSSDQQPCLVWLDYECFPDEDVLYDIRTICSRAAPGSVFFLTINASHRNLGRNSAEREERIRCLFENSVPNDLPKDWDNRMGLPRLLGRILTRYAKHHVNISERKEEFHPIANILYTDGAPMVTVGGVIQKSAPENLCPLGEPEDQYNLQVPVLTAREKLALDQILPRDEPISEDEMQKEIGFTLCPDEFEDYRKHYRRYPVFQEVSF